MISGLERPSASAPFDVGAGTWVRAHAGEHDAPQGVVGLAVAAAVEPVAGHLAGRGVDRGDAAEVSEGGLGGDPLGVVAGGDEQQGGGVDADTGQVEQARGGRFDEVGELTVKAGAVGVDVEDAATEGLHRQLGGIQHWVAVAVRAQRRGGLGETGDGTPRNRSRSSSGAQKPRWRSWLRHLMRVSRPER